MKTILGLDLGTTSIGWALVNEAEPGDKEQSSIIRLGSRVVPLSVDETMNFAKGKSITTNADRTLKRGMRRNLQRYKLRRENLIEILQKSGIIQDNVIFSEDGKASTFETYRFRAKAVTEQVPLLAFARILLMINKKRGYKSSRKAKSQDEGQLIDGMSIAKILYEENITPGQYVYQSLKDGGKSIPEFYRSDLQTELDRIWEFQQQFYPEILTPDFKPVVERKGKREVSAVFLARYSVYAADNKGADRKLEAYKWRTDALSKQLNIEQVAFVIGDICGVIKNSSGYLGAISDRSKELYFDKKTVGQCLMAQLDANPHTSLVNQVFYRQDYLDEFNAVWEKQAQYHDVLTPELKSEIRDVVIFHQRKLKSQKGLISFCELESKTIKVKVDGEIKEKTSGLRVCPKSSPLFQEFKIWQILNNLTVTDGKAREKRLLDIEEKQLLFKELDIKGSIKENEAIKLLFGKAKNLSLNFEKIDGNKTQASLFNAYQHIIEESGHGEHDFSKMDAEDVRNLVKSVFNALAYNTAILDFDSGLEGDAFEKQPLFKLWHLLYSYEDDNSNTGNQKLIDKIVALFGFAPKHAAIIANTVFQYDYGSLSTKAMKKVLPFMKDGTEYSAACVCAKYNHSKDSLTREEIKDKIYKDRLDILPKNSLRNPVVEKILNQMVNVVNSVIDTYGKVDEIRIELARDLKKNAKERENMTVAMNSANKEHERIRGVLRKEFNLSYISRTDIIRYKLYLELKDNNFHTLYSNTYISPEKLFSKDFDIEHIIPKSRLFDDSFSNKTLELRSINIEKGNKTAYDFVSDKYGKDGLEDYMKRLDILFKNKLGYKTKLRKLTMVEKDIPDDFIERDLRNTQYIAKKAKEMLEDLVPRVVSTSGSVTDRLRQDWQLIDVMQELNWDKYDKLGLTQVVENRDGHKIKRITDWTKRNDHRHHAMDALTVAFTKQAYIQYLNKLNARNDRASDIYDIETKNLKRDDNNKLRFTPPMPLDEFRAEAKKHLESILISAKAKNKVVTININSTRKKGALNRKKQLTPRGQLHNGTIYGRMERYVSKEEKVGANFNEEQINKVANKKYREALLLRLQQFDNDPKKAFIGKNSLGKNPIYLDDSHTYSVPEKVKTVQMEVLYTIRKSVDPSLKLEKVVDCGVKAILQARLDECGGDAAKAFGNLDEKPIWLNKTKGIAIKRVTITPGVNNAEALHYKKDKDGREILNDEGKPFPVDFVNTGNNHHVAVYCDANGVLQESVISFYEAVARANQGLPIIDKEYRNNDGWQFLFSMKQNEYFVFPNKDTGFDPRDIDLMSQDNYSLISLNLFRGQQLSTRDYVFRHHLETSVEKNNVLQGVTWIRTGLKGIEGVVKVRVSHIGEIVHVGE